MKNYQICFLICFMLTALTGSAQLGNMGLMDGQGRFKNLQIGYSKTTSIVFPYAIKSVDKGSQEILLQKVEAAENVLLVKAGQKNFSQTNLTVITSDGKLYGFILNYDDLCPDLNFSVDNSIVLNREILFSLENKNQKEVEQYGDLALSKNKKRSGLKSNRFDMKLELDGTFIHQNVIYCRLVISNNSKINYDIDQLRFFICDQKKSKRTASQEIEVLPLSCTSKVKTIFDESQVTVVFAFQKFTIPEKKYLTIQLIEKNGGRQIEIDIKNKDLTNLEVLNTL